MSQRMEDGQAKAGAYLRRSTELPGQEKSLEEQYRAIKKAAADMGRELCEDSVFKDSVTGTTTEGRDNFEALKQAARDGTLKKRGVDTILIFAIDRAGRKTVDVLVFATELQKYGIRVYSVSEGIDSSTPEGMMALTAQAMAAEASNRLRAADVRRGKRRAILRGVHDGPAPYGYQKSNKRLAVCFPRAAVVRSIFRSYLNGDSPRSIARALNDKRVPAPRGKQWGALAVRQLLGHEVYAGIATFGFRQAPAYRGNPRDTAIVAPSNHPAIVDLDTFVEAQKLAARRTSRRHLTRNSGHIYVLGGIKVLHCGLCGRALFGTRWNNGKKVYTYYECKSGSQIGRKCGLPLIPCDLVDLPILDCIARYISSPVLVRRAWARHQRAIAPQLKPIQAELDETDGRLKQIEARTERLAQAFSTAEIALPVLKEQVRKEQAETERLKARRADLLVERAQVTKTMADTGLLEKLADFGGRFHELAPGARKLLVQRLIRSVVIYSRERIEVTLRFLPEAVRVTACKDDRSEGHR